LEDDVVRQVQSFQQLSDEIAQDSVSVPVLNRVSVEGIMHVTSMVPYVVVSCVLSSVLKTKQLWRQYWILHTIISSTAERAMCFEGSRNKSKMQNLLKQEVIGQRTKRSAKSEENKAKIMLFGWKSLSYTRHGDPHATVFMFTVLISPDL
jgi:hypothetical protein